MDIVNEMDLHVTIIDHGAADGTLPYMSKDEKDLASRMKAMLCADDLRIEDRKQFNVPSEEDGSHGKV